MSTSTSTGVFVRGYLPDQRMAERPGTDAVTANLVRLRRKAVVLRTSLENLITELANNPEPGYHSILNQYDTILHQMNVLREDVQPVLAHTLIYPGQLPVNPQDVPILLSTREDLAMEAEKEATGKLAKPVDRVALERHSSMIDSLEAIVATFVEKEAAEHSGKRPREA